jgi:hypothetical protein
MALAEAARIGARCVVHEGFPYKVSFNRVLLIALINDTVRNANGPLAKANYETGRMMVSEFITRSPNTLTCSGAIFIYQFT